MLRTVWLFYERASDKVIQTSFLKLLQIAFLHARESKELGTFDRLAHYLKKPDISFFCFFVWSKNLGHFFAYFFNRFHISY